MRHLVLILSLVGTVVLTTPAYASTITFTNRATFEAALGVSVTDDYSAAGYQHGDRYDGDDTDYFTNAAMSAVLGETDYQSTRSTIEQMNLIAHEATNDYYCGGCNGSFRLLFSTTSVGTASGVYGAGFNYVNQARPGLPLYQAFVTFGDGTTANYELASNGQYSFPSFFGIASDLNISSIHLGLVNGQSTHDGSFAIDNLTIGTAVAAQSVPDPVSSLTLLVIGLTGLALARRSH